MVAKNYQVCEDRIIAHEGGYTDGIHPYDPGGCTNLGVTIEDARRYWKANATCSDVKVLPKPVASDIIRGKYWMPLHCDDLPSGVDDSVVDYGYNSGIGRAGKVLRRLVGLPDNTSAINNEVLAAVAKRDPKAIIVSMNNERLQFLQTLAIWPTYQHGWTTRVNDVRNFSLQLASGQAPSPITPGAGGAKGKHPKPTTSKTIAKGGVAAGPVAGVGFWDWVQSNPMEAILIFAALIAAVAVIVHFIDKRYLLKQEAPTPGLVPVPVTGG